MKKYFWIFLFLCVSLFSFSATIKTYDVSQKELIQISHEIVEELFEENTEMWKQLLIGTLAVETNLGQFKGNSPYGVAQMRNSGFQFVQGELKKRGEESEVFETLTGKPVDRMKLSMLEKDHRMAILYMAYYYKFLVKDKIEDSSIDEAANIWKKYYNTRLGKGTPEAFKKAYQRQEKYLNDFDLEVSGATIKSREENEKEI